MVLFLGSPAFAVDYYDALRAAQQEKKPVLLYFFSQSCGYCTMMDKETLADKEIGSMLKKDFVFLRVDSDRWTDLAPLYELRGTPTAWFLDSSGQRIRQVPGYVEKGDYKTLLEYVKGKHYKSMGIQAYFKKSGRR